MRRLLATTLARAVAAWRWLQILREDMLLAEIHPYSPLARTIHARREAQLPPHSRVVVEQGESIDISWQPLDDQRVAAASLVLRHGERVRA